MAEDKRIEVRSTNRCVQCGKQWPGPMVSICVSEFVLQGGMIINGALCPECLARVERTQRSRR